MDKKSVKIIAFINAISGGGGGVILASIKKIKIVANRWKQSKKNF